MTDHVRDVAAVRTATERLLGELSQLDPAALAEASLLPAWTRGHVLAHIARNADGLVNVLAGRPMYVGPDARNADIERDAPRPLDVHLSDIQAGADLFEQACAAPADWSRTVVLSNGVTDSASRIPFRRLVEVELHHVDLGIGYTLQSLPGDFTEQAIGYLAERFAGRGDVPVTTLADGDGRTWQTGGAATGAPLHVSGTPADLLGWLAGRGDGSALQAQGGARPVLPTL